MSKAARTNNKARNSGYSVKAYRGNRYQPEETAVQQWHPTAKDLDEVCKISTDALEGMVANGDIGGWVRVI